MLDHLVLRQRLPPQLQPQQLHWSAAGSHSQVDVVNGGGQTDRDGTGSLSCVSSATATNAEQDISALPTGAGEDDVDNQQRQQQHHHQTVLNPSEENVHGIGGGGPGGGGSNTVNDLDVLFCEDTSMPYVDWDRLEQQLRTALKLDESKPKRNDRDAILRRLATGSDGEFCYCGCGCGTDYGLMTSSLTSKQQHHSHCHQHQQHCSILHRRSAPALSTLGPYSPSERYRKTQATTTTMTSGTPSSAAHDSTVYYQHQQELQQQQRNRQQELNNPRHRRHSGHQHQGKLRSRRITKQHFCNCGVTVDLETTGLITDDINETNVNDNSKIMSVSGGKCGLGNNERWSSLSKSANAAAHESADSCSSSSSSSSSSSCCCCEGGSLTERSRLDRYITSDDRNGPHLLHCSQFDATTEVTSTAAAAAAPDALNREQAEELESTDGPVIDRDQLLQPEADERQRQQRQQHLHSQLTSTRTDNDSQSTSGLNNPQLTDPKDFIIRQARLQVEATLALAQVRPMARMQLQLEKQQRRKSPIADMVGLPWFGDGRSHNRLCRSVVLSMKLPQLQVIVNDMFAQIELFNAELMQLLEERDELHMAQDSMLVDVEDLTRRSHECMEQFTTHVTK